MSIHGSVCPLAPATYPLRSCQMSELLDPAVATPPFLQAAMREWYRVRGTSGTQTSSLLSSSTNMGFPAGRHVSVFGPSIAVEPSIV